MILASLAGLRQAVDIPMEIGIAVIIEAEQTEMPATVAAVLRTAERSDRAGFKFQEHFVQVNRDDESVSRERRKKLYCIRDSDSTSRFIFDFVVNECCLNIILCCVLNY